MKKADGTYVEIIVTLMEDTTVVKRAFWGHSQAMQYIHRNAPIMVAGYYERTPVKYNRKDFPELYD